MMGRLLSACLLLLFALPAGALDASGLGKLPVLHEGRIKPLQTIARLYAPLLKGDQPDALAGMAAMLFEPAKALKAPRIAVYSAPLRAMLDLPERPAHRYSYHEITPRLKAHKALLERLASREASRFTAQERALWNLYEQIDMITQLTGSFSLFIPVLPSPSPSIRDRYGIPPDASHYVALQPFHAQIAADAAQILKEQEEADISPGQHALVSLSMQLDVLASMGQENHWLRIIPSTHDDASVAWRSAWQSALDMQREENQTTYLSAWEQLARAYRAEDATRWQTALAELNQQMQRHPAVQPPLLLLERWYQQWPWMDITISLYGLALLTGASAALWPSRKRERMGSAMLFAALLLHGLMLVARIVVLQRPPVTTLYESILFVAFLSAGAAGGLYWRGRYQAGLVMASILGGGLLAVSGLYAGQGDPLAPPIAVLNTNFWLATHVICITAGYAATLLCGAAAHVILYYPQPRLTRLLVPLTVVALLLTAFGTILGGIWADQSWGRFWGWDPKENGALLIVLWLVWLLHSRMTQHIGQDGFMALLAASTIIVALSWFGVNLLNTGLHSYGFTDAAALGLLGFCITEIMVIALLYGRRKCA